MLSTNQSKARSFYWADRTPGPQTSQHTKKTVCIAAFASAPASLQQKSRSPRPTWNISEVDPRTAINDLILASLIKQRQMLLIQPHIRDSQIVPPHIQPIHFIMELLSERVRHKRIFRHHDSPATQPRSIINPAIQTHRSEISTFSPPQVFSWESRRPSFHHSLLVANIPIVIGEKSSVFEPPPQNWRSSAVMEAELPMPSHTLLGMNWSGSRRKLTKFTRVLGS